MFVLAWALLPPYTFDTSLVVLLLVVVVSFVRLELGYRSENRFRPKLPTLEHALLGLKLRGYLPKNRKTVLKAYTGARCASSARIRESNRSAWSHMAAFAIALGVVTGLAISLGPETILDAASFKNSLPKLIVGGVIILLQSSDIVLLLNPVDCGADEEQLFIEDFPHLAGLANAMRQEDDDGLKFHINGALQRLETRYGPEETHSSIDRCRTGGPEMAECTLLQVLPLSRRSLPSGRKTAPRYNETRV